MAKLTAAQLKKFKGMLVQYLQHLGVTLEHMEEAVLRAEVDASPEDGDEFGNGSNTREFEIGLIENEGVILQEVREALERIESKKYGQCLHCNEMIPLGRLEVLPYARFCLEHQRLHELGQLELD